MSVLDHPAGGPDPRRPAIDPDAPPSTSMIVRPWWDPQLATTGVDPRSTYVERYWLGVVGPSAVLLLRRFARGLEEHPEGFRISLADTARAIGLGAGVGRQSPINRTIDRACLFNTMRRVATDEVQVRTHLPLLNARQLSRLPLAVRNSHALWLAHQDETGPSAPPPQAA
jgi:hypothetical protein